MTVKFTSLEQYVQDRQGKRVLKKILVANNGIAAVKGIRSIRQWIHTHFQRRDLVKFVVMATPDDIEGNAEYVRLADEIHQVPGGASANNYSNVDLIVDIARLRHCDAVWPGWGHASEHPELPRALRRNGIEFIGPDADAMYVLGDKISSSIIAETAQVPTMPWSGTGLRCKPAPSATPGERPNVSEMVPEDLFEKACVSSVEEALESAKKIGFPIMVKASEGGGGKGIRMVRNEDELRQGFRQITDEVIGSPIFLMKLGNDCRHVEVQVVADEYNNAIALFSRDCSVQRRHQKIIEEGPVTVAPADVLREMEAAACRLSRQVHYRGAGTVEYLYIPSESKFYFLELNPRLQVEHPVTERITNCSVPSIQFNIAMGVPLNMIPDIRRFYGCNEDGDSSGYYYGKSKIDFISDRPIDPIGHCIACRITAENPEDGFQPTSGSVKELTFVSTPNVWGYFSIRNHGSIHSYSDSQFGHLFAHGPNRDEARKSMLHALYELSIRGEIRTTTEYLVSLLEHPVFIDNQVTTSWLDKLIQNKSIALPKPDRLLVVQCGAIHTLHEKFALARQSWISALDKGQQPSEDYLKAVYPVELIYEDKKYSIIGSISGPNRYSLVLNDSVKDIEVRPLSDGALLVMMNDGSSHISHAQKEPTGLRVTVDGKVCLFSEESDPSQLRANASGKLVRYLIEEGDYIQAGASYVELEVMKMIMTLKAPLSGRIQLKSIEGGTVQAGDILAVLDLDDKTQVKRSERFEGQFDDLETVELEHPNKQVSRSLETLYNILNGYIYPSIALNDRVKIAMSGLSCLAEPHLVILGEFRECVGATRNALPKPLYDTIQSILNPTDGKSSFSIDTFKTLREAIDSFVQKKYTREDDRKEFLKKIDRLTAIFSRVDKGMKAFVTSCLAPLLELYYNNEVIFDQGKRHEEVILELREVNKDTLTKTFEILFSHARLREKNKVVKNVLQLVEHHEVVKECREILEKISNMRGRHYSDVVLSVKQILLRDILPSHDLLHIQMKEHFEQALQAAKDDSRVGLCEDQRQILQPLIEKSNYNFDVLMNFFFGEGEADFDSMAIEVYIRKSYQTFDVNIEDIDVSSHNKFKSCCFKFVNKEDHGQVMINKDVILGSASSDSISSLAKLQESEGSVGYGVLLLFNCFDDFKKYFGEALELFKKSGTDDTNVLHVYIQWDEKKPQDETLIEQFSTVLDQYKSRLNDEVDVKRVTIVVNVPNKLPYYYTFRQRLDFAEDPIYRHIEPTLAFQLYLRKLSNYNISSVPIQTPSTHIYYATKKKKSRRLGDVAASATTSKYDYLDTRFFVRTLVLRGDTLMHSQDDKYKQSIYISESHRYLNDSLKHLELAMSDTENYNPTYCNHIFVNVIPPVIVNGDMVNQMMKDFQTMYAKRLWRLRISEVELKVNVKTSPNDTESVPLHIFATNKTGYHLVIEIYQENRKNGQLVYSAMNKIFGYEGDCPLDNVPISSPYPLLKPSHMKRRIAHNYDTSYVLDFPFLFRRQIKQTWKAWLSLLPKEKAASFKIPKETLEYTELILDQTTSPARLIECDDPSVAEQYRNGMVAWKMTLFTPEYPTGRDIIVISNDITYQSGSFGPEEDELFNLASKLSRDLRIPRIYITANSGARIGIANEVKSCFRVAWNDPENPQRGYKYLYLTEKDFEKLKESVIAERVSDSESPDEVRYRILDIIGKDHGIGVENLRGSGMIAGETSRAYKDVFTINYVASRTVGIGAYLVRLGQRVIQNKNPPILLTGAGALNQVLNRKVYNSNLQLGGIQIMYPNGVTHSVVKDDKRGVETILKWLSYIPKHKDAPLPLPPFILDEWDRDVTFTWTRETVYDPRHMIQGVQSSDEYLYGLFDKDSFFETLGGWAKNIVVGRARLSGIPMGIISVNVATIQQVIPADPADDNSQERVLQKAGQVWFPDSAYKTAQAIQDFNNGEQLPLMIFANWRGFSGGQRDMFEEILKFGSYIVDALVDYKQPVFVYIPPYGELRGGAWVVVDPTINEDMMEMYADTDAKGGVLEPNGTVEIKYRTPDVENTIRRLDSVYINLARRLADPNLSLGEKADVEVAMKSRIKELIPIYNHVAIKFCDLHDTPGRMKQKGVISEVVPWKESRRFFYWRLRRRLAELQIHRSLVQINPDLSYAQKQQLVNSSIPSELLSDNQKVVEFIESRANSILQSLEKDVRAEVIQSKFKALLQGKSEDKADLLKTFASVLSDDEKSLLKNYL